MPKLKTHKGAQARIYITGTGKLMRTKIGKTHFRRRKPNRVKRLFDSKLPVSSAHTTRLKRLLVDRL